MFRELFYYFSGLLNNGVTTGTTIYGLLNTSNLTLFGVSLTLSNYIAFLLSLICFIFIFVLCCLFIWKLIKLVGRLFSGGAL